MIVSIHRLPGTIAAWSCAHAPLQKPRTDGDILLCAACAAAVKNEGAQLTMEETGKPFTGA